MKDHIVPVDIHKQYMADMQRYSLYVLYERYTPGIDGLKPVQRRILYCMWHDIKCTSLNTKRKSANTVGTVIAKYHSHGDCIFGPNTYAYTLSGEMRTIEDLYNSGIRSFESLGVNETTGEVEPIVVTNLRIGQYTNKIYNIHLSNGAEIKCTGNHPIMLKDTSYIKAKDIYNYYEFTYKDEDKVELFATDNNGNIGNTSIRIEDVYIEYVDNVPMYDFTVDSTHNMLFPMIGPNDNFEDFPMVCMHNSAVYEAMKPMTNWYEIKCPLIVYDSNSGSIQGGPQAAMRYTESCLSQFSMDALFGDLIESKMVVDWSKTFDNHTEEPDLLPIKIPLLLVNGTFGIAIGRRIEVPKHSLNDVIDATINVLKNPNAKVILIPDPCQKCEVVDTDWKKISNMGFGYFTERGIVDIESDKNGNQILHIRSMPDMIFANTVLDKIEDLIKENKLVQINDIQDHSTEEQLDIWLILKKGSDAEYVKQVLYKNTPLQDTKRVNMEVMIGDEIKRLSYKAYIVAFIEFRRNVKFRLYNARLQKAETRLHTIELFIAILESGDVENIIHAIRNQKPSEEAQLIEWLMKKLKITDLQAKFILNTEIKKLSKGNLNRYKEEQKELNKQVKHYINMITKPELIDKEIEEELLEIRKKYGQPRKSVVISEAEASDIPQGTFKIVVSEMSFIKKMQVSDPIKLSKGDSPKCITVGDNSKDLLLFDEMGKVFRLPIHKLAFTDKNSPGIDIRMVLKKLTSNIVSVMYLPIIENLANKSSKYFIVTVTKQGLIKKMDLDDIISATPSGIIYSKLNKGDSVCDIIIANHKSDVIIYNKTKAIRISIDSIPYLKRSTLGSISMKTNEPIDGISVVTSDTKDVVVVTAKGKFNRISQSALARTERNRAGSKVIKLTKGDYIKNIFTCSDNMTIRAIHMDGTVSMVKTSDISMGSSVSSGDKLTKEIVKAELIKEQ